MQALARLPTEPITFLRRRPLRPPNDALQWSYSTLISITKQYHPTGQKFDLHGTPLTRQALLSPLHPQHQKQRTVVFHAPRSGPGGHTAAHVYCIELHLAEVQLAALQEELSQMV